MTGVQGTLYFGRMMAGHESFACLAKETRIYPKDNGKHCKSLNLELFFNIRF